MDGGTGGEMNVLVTPSVKAFLSFKTFSRACSSIVNRRWRSSNSGSLDSGREITRYNEHV